MLFITLMLLAAIRDKAVGLGRRHLIDFIRERCLASARLWTILGGAGIVVHGPCDR